MRKTFLLLLAAFTLLVTGCRAPAVPLTEAVIPLTRLPLPTVSPSVGPTFLPPSPTHSPQSSLVPTPAQAPITLDNASQLAALDAPLDLGESLVRLAMSPVGDQVTVAGESGRIYLIDSDTLTVQTTLDTPDPVRSLAVDQGGLSAVGTVNGQVLIAARDGSIVQTIRLSDAGVPVNALAYMLDGSWLAAALNNGSVMILDPDTGSTTKTLSVGALVRALIYSPDGAILITAGDEGLIRYWDTASGEPLYTGEIGHTAAVRSLAQTEDGIILASGGADAEIKIYDGYSAQWINTLQGHNGPVEALAFSPDGTLLASGDSAGQLIIWDVVIGQPLLTLDTVHDGGVSGLAFSPDGTELITAGVDGAIRTWGILTP